jgi:hypothetical protein
VKKEILSLEHEEKLSQILSNINVGLSEFSFANLYLFREKHNYRLIDDNGDLFLSGITYDNKTFLMPLCDLSNKENEAYLSDLIALSIDYDMIYPIPENWLYLFPTDSFDISYIEDDSDYLYEIDTFVSYPGRKLHAKRNLVAQFLRDYNAEILPLNEENAHLATEVLNRWQKDSGMKKEETDFFPCLECLQNVEKFNQIGEIFFINGIPQGFVMGERYNKEYCVIHFAKGNNEIKGIYQYMFSVFAGHNKEALCNFVNLEQDLGKEGLRAMKKSYLPIDMLLKYRVFIK